MNEEQWSLRDVVFVEDVKNVPVGKVCSILLLHFVQHYYSILLA